MSAEAAAASAARHILIELFPKQKEMIEQAYTASVKAIPDGPAKTQGVALGERAANAVIADRATDGATVPDTYRPLTSPGVWVPTTPPITEQFARARPWVLKSANQFRPGPPPQLTSTIYARDYNETKNLGGAQSKARTAEQTETVRFWRTPNLAPAWQAAARQFAMQRELSLAECARLFALLNMAGINSYIADWDAKFTYNFWRPVTAIRNGDLDGNDATERDAGLESDGSHPGASGISVAGEHQRRRFARDHRSRPGTKRGGFLHRDRYLRPEADPDGEQSCGHGRRAQERAGLGRHSFQEFPQRCPGHGSENLGLCGGQRDNAGALSFNSGLVPAAFEPAAGTNDMRILLLCPPWQFPGRGRILAPTESVCIQTSQGPAGNGSLA